jgi:hypothetical protein
MFEYLNIDEEKIKALQNSSIGALSSAGLLIANGVVTGILTADEAIEQMYNIFLTIFEKETDDE